VTLEDAVKLIAALGMFLGGLAGCGWIGKTIYTAIFGGDERRANAAVAITGAAKQLVDELQEEVSAARVESRLAREETKAARAETKIARDETASAREEIEILRRNISEMRRLTELEISRLKRENAQLAAQLANGRAS
jgi:hypothetical protein